MTTSSPYVSERFISATPEAVAVAISSPYGLGTWCCDDAHSEKQPDGRLVLGWHDGRQASGRWKKFEPPTGLAWSVRHADGGEQIVSFTLTPDGEGTRTSLAVEGSSDATAARWEHALGDLATYVETGRDERMARRPMLGIFPDFDEAPEGIPDGVRVGGAVDGSGAEAAGLAEGDVMLALGSHRVSDWGSLGPALDGHSAGDTVDVQLWRDGSERTVPLTLGSRPQPNAPEGAEAVASWIESETDTLIERLADVLEEISPDEADFRPGEREWNVREVIGHLITTERFSQLNTMLFAADVERAGWPGSTETRLQRVLSHVPLDSLRTMLFDHLRQSAGIARDILESESRPPIVRGLADGQAFTEMHVGDHIGQIKTNVAMAREQAVPV